MGWHLATQRFKTVSWFFRWGLVKNVESSAIGTHQYDDEQCGPWESMWTLGITPRHKHSLDTWTEGGVGGSWGGIQLDNNAWKRAVTNDKPGAVTKVFNSETGKLFGIHFSYYAERKKIKCNSRRFRGGTYLWSFVGMFLKKMLILHSFIDLYYWPTLSVAEWNVRIFKNVVRAVIDWFNTSCIG